MMIRTDKKIMNSNIFTSTGIALLTLVLFGCATVSSVSQNPAERQQKRKEAIIQSIQNDLTAGQRYINFGFGDEYISKPPSFKPLDSLYAVKYEESRYGGLTRNREQELNTQIADLLSKIQKDTVLFKYEINHLFGIEEQDSILFTSATFVLNTEHEVEKVNIDFLFKDHKKFVNQFTEYMRKESFLYASSSPTDEERQFYNFFSVPFDNAGSAERKGDVIAHILHVMRAAAVQKSLNSELVIKQLILNDITASVKDYKPVTWSSVYTTVDEDNNLNGYFVDHEWNYVNLDGESYTLKRRFEMDVYFRTTSVLAIDKIESEE